MKLDFKQREATGGLYLLEANPRFNLWHHAGAVAGVNLPLLVYRDPVAPGSVHAAVCRRGRTCGGCRRRSIWSASHSTTPRVSSAGFGGCAICRRDVVEDLCWRDPLPGVVRLVAKAGKQVTRLLPGRGAAPLAAGTALGAQ